MKIRVYPTQNQKILYDKLFNIQRFIYNSVLTFIADYQAIHDNKFPKLKTIRENMIHNDSPFTLNNDWLLKETVYDFRDEVMMCCLKNYKSSFARYKNDSKPFKIQFKSKKYEQLNGASISILSKYWNTGDKSWWSKLWTPEMKCLDKRDNNKLPSKLQHTSRLIKTPSNKYYIAMPIDKPELKENSHNITVIDPGIRTFSTGYNLSNNSIEEIGMGLSGTISRLHHQARKLQSKISNKKDYNHRQRYHFKRAYKRALEHIKNKIDDLHKHAAKHLCENNSLIVIPKLNFHNLDKLNKKSKSVAQTISHCSFVDRLITKATQYKNCHVEIVSEHWTSKSCSSCGNINHTLGSSKTFSCNKCNYIADRDANAAKNIFYKFINERVPFNTLLQVL